MESPGIGFVTNYKDAGALASFIKKTRKKVKAGQPHGHRNLPDVVNKVMGS